MPAKAEQSGSGQEMSFCKRTYYTYIPFVLFPFAFCKHRDLFSIEVRQAWGAGFSDQHLSCLWSYSRQGEHPLSLETWDEHREVGKRTFLDTLLSPQPVSVNPGIRRPG